MTDKKPAPTRIYLVRDAAGRDRLIEASSPGSAVAHAYVTNVRTPSASEVADLIESGVKRERAKSSTQPSLPLPKFEPASAATTNDA